MLLLAVLMSIIMLASHITLASHNPSGLSPENSAQKWVETSITVGQD
jgi:hypothetical protein